MNSCPIKILGFLVKKLSNFVKKGQKISVISLKMVEILVLR